MRKTFFLFITKILFIACIVALANTSNAQVALSSVYTLDKYNTADTLKAAANGESIGNFKDWYLEAQNLSPDSTRTFTLSTISKLSPDTTINVNIQRLDSATSTTTSTFGQQTLYPGQRKLFKVYPDNLSAFVITGEGRYTTRFILWAAERIKF
jgi:hypothetical protein